MVKKNLDFPRHGILDCIYLQVNGYFAVAECSVVEVDTR